MVEPVFRRASLLELEAWHEAQQVQTIWRVHYRLPPNDARFLSMPHSAMVRDLLVIRYRDHLDRLATDKTYAAEYAAGDSQLQDRLSKLQEVLLEDTTLGDMAHAHYLAQQGQADTERVGTPAEAAGGDGGRYTTITIGGDRRGA